MNIPELPTDNLYKFQALAGTTLSLATLVLLAFMLTRERPDVRQARANVNSCNAKILAIEKSKNELDSTMKAQAYIYGFYFDTLKEKYIQIRDSSLINKWDEFNKQMDNLITKKGEMESLKLTLQLESIEDNEIWEDSNYDYKNLLPIYMAVLYGLFAAGTFVAVAGFFKWYKYLQRYQDMIVREQAGFSNTKFIEEEEKNEEEKRKAKEKKKLSGLKRFLKYFSGV